MACEALHYHPVDAPMWARAKKVVAQDYGIDIDEDRGEASRSGFTLRWAYDPAASTLEIQCVGKPFFIPCDVVNERIKATAAKFGVSGGG